MRSRLARAALFVIRGYTRHSPWRRGKYRLIMASRGLTEHLPRQTVVPTVDGRSLLIDWSTGMAETLYFLGEYERAVTNVVVDVVRPGDVCLHVGASMGWYTTLLRDRCGDAGEVHAFEPLPEAFARLRTNVDLAGAPSNVFLNRMVLGDETKPALVHVFAGLPEGHASLSSMGRRDGAPIEAPMRTIDGYLAANGVGRVAFVKLDIEGAELLFLRGAERLLRQSPPPTFVIEMAAATSRSFGYSPNDLIEFMCQRSSFDFLTIDDVTGRLAQIEKFATDSPGAYVLCVPRGGL